ncbi:MAG: NADH-quinone oxidoreductase subunit J [Actinomycetota bacterium]
MRAALFLVVVLGGIGAIFLILGSEFIAWTQILIYVGAVVVLLLFGLMLTQAPIGRTAVDNEKRLIALVTSAGVFAMLTYLVWNAFGNARIPLDTVIGRTKDLGSALFSGYILPFELVSVLLLGALVGAIVLAKKD